MTSKFLKAALAAGAALGLAGPAAAVTITSVAAPNVYSGPFTLNFDGTDPAGFYNPANVFTGNDANPQTRAAPVGSSGSYFSVGPTAGSPRVIELSSFASIGTISFLWGSIDTYNSLQLLNAANGVMATFAGNNVPGASNFGNQSSPLSNRLVTLTFTGAERQAISALRLTSTQNAFEIDSLTVGVVPEPATWAMMIGGFGLVGAALRRRRAVAPVALA
jgi:hypothetical protein